MAPICESQELTCQLNILYRTFIELNSKILKSATFSEKEYTKMDF